MRLTTYLLLGCLGSFGGLACAGGADDPAPGGGGDAGFAGSFFGGSGGSGASTSGGASGSSTGGAGGAVGGAGGLAGGAGSGGTTGCNDPGPEPNDTLPKATPVCSSPPCELSCKDDQGGTLTGVAAPGDVDLFTYFGNDTITCSVNPYAKTDDSGFRLCMWAQCADGKDTTIKTCGSGTATDGPGGLKGCCAQAPVALEIEHDCPGLTDNDSGAIYIQIDQASACTSYTVDYHF
ncbi:MAG: hypothetical protein R3B13_27285 [Polyangiaceae bacterium]